MPFPDREGEHTVLSVSALGRHLAFVFIRYRVSGLGLPVVMAVSYIIHRSWPTGNVEKPGIFKHEININ